MEETFMYRYSFSFFNNNTEKMNKKKTIIINEDNEFKARHKLIKYIDKYYIQSGYLNVTKLKIKLDNVEKLKLSDLGGV